MATLSQPEQNMNTLREMDVNKEARADDKMSRAFAEKENVNTKLIRVDNVFKGRENLKNILRSKCENVVPAVQNQIAIYQDEEDGEDADVSIKSVSMELNKTMEEAAVNTNSRNPLQELPLPVTKPEKISMITDRDRFLQIYEYRYDILKYLLEAEHRSRPKSNYLQKQPDINSQMRTVLVDWMVEVCEEYKLDTETLYLAVSYVDRFLSYMSVVRGKLQLVGTTAMYIAAKYEEIYPPDASDFVYITDETYTNKQVLRMEQLILKVLSFDLSTPTAYTFICMYTAIEEISEPMKFLAMFFCELALIDADTFLPFLPSQLAAAGVALARFHHGQSLWTRSLTETTGYNVTSIRDLVCLLNKAHHICASMKQKAIVEKYRSSKYLCVSEGRQRANLSAADFEAAAQEIAREDEEAVDRETNENVSKMISSLLFE
ncbi:G2/mitotic-specific cyclin-A [Phlebotomus argentipes]|uniref:G2/mitotic-specific cyclin-A n=1 Tax=Phlebotomus argentipes TaxID=94469 RepID=UPI0028934861|nr:G2/mitotic-specific cyclin-A [Phlebotomus argentipes]